jgi:DNA-binding NarL/FixJ family response regulator
MRHAPGLLNAQPDIEVVGEADNGQEAIARVAGYNNLAGVQP